MNYLNAFDILSQENEEKDKYKTLNEVLGRQKIFEDVIVEKIKTL